MLLQFVLLLLLIILMEYQKDTKYVSFSLYCPENVESFIFWKHKKLKQIHTAVSQSDKLLAFVFCVIHFTFFVFHTI